MFDQMHVHGVLPHHADRLIMPPMADVDDLVAFAHETQYLTMHLADQRAGGVHDVHAAACGLRLDLRRHAVRGEHDRDAGGSSLVRYLRELLHEHGPLRGEILDDMPVVHDLTTHIHRRQAIHPRRRGLQDGLHGKDRPIHPGAESARVRQHDAFRHIILLMQSVAAMRHHSITTTQRSKGTRTGAAGTSLRVRYRHMTTPGGNRRHPDRTRQKPSAHYDSER